LVFTMCVSAVQVVAVLMRGLERGKYHLVTPDLGSNLLVNKMSATGPKVLPLALSMLLSPIVELVTTIVGAGADKAARKHNQKYGYATKT
jgi:hypothetical protein